MRRRLLYAAAPSLLLLAVSGGWAVYDRLRPKSRIIRFWNP